MDLQALFPEPILEQVRFEPDYPGHGDDVVQVRTAHETVVVRLARCGASGGFWDGLQHLFGIDSTRSFHLEALNQRLNRLSDIHVPQVKWKSLLNGRECIVVNFLPGTKLKTFYNQPDTLLEHFGSSLAQFHRERFSYFGNFDGSTRHPLSDFHIHVTETMRFLVDRYHAGDTALKEWLTEIVNSASRLSVPQSASWVQVDIDATQYLSNGQKITALIDTEAHVIAPRELDFVAVEYVFGRREAAAFAQGYASVLPVPDLSLVRPVYRFLYRLFEIQGDEQDINTWMNWPKVFD